MFQAEGASGAGALVVGHCLGCLREAGSWASGSELRRRTIVRDEAGEVMVGSDRVGPWMSRDILWLLL